MPLAEIKSYELAQGLVKKNKTALTFDTTMGAGSEMLGSVDLECGVSTSVWL